jgi:hypothetical protein
MATTLLRESISANCKLVRRLHNASIASALGAA